MDVFVAVEVFVRAVLAVVARNPEDGSEVVREVFEVVAEDARGARVAHRRRFVADEAGADALAARVRAAGRALDLAHWDEVDPCYGSAAYVEDEPFQVARERAEDRARDWA